VQAQLEQVDLERGAHADRLRQGVLERRGLELAGGDVAAP